MLARRLYPHWLGSTVIVAATGPSLTEDVAAKCIASGLHTVAVNDAYLLFPNADILYACDAAWWDHHEGVPKFRGERWSSHNPDPDSKAGSKPIDDKLEAAKRWGLNLIRGEIRPGFSFDSHCIHYGGNSGFQAINIAIHLGAARIILVGFNMRNGSKPTGRGRGSETIYHFFGPHRGPKLRNNDPLTFVPQFNEAARRMNGRVEIINCTPDSALRCFPWMDLERALATCR